MKNPHEISSYALILINLSKLRNVLEKAGFCTAGRPVTEEELHIVYTYSVLLRTIIKEYAQVQQHITQLEHNQFACKQLNRDVTIALEHNTANEDAIGDKEQLHILAGLQEDLKQQLNTDKQSMATLNQTLDHIIAASEKAIGALQQEQKTRWIPELKKNMSVQNPKKSIAEQLNTLADSLNPESIRSALKAEHIQAPAHSQYWQLMATLLREPQPQPPKKKQDAPSPSSKAAAKAATQPPPQPSTTVPRPTPTEPKPEHAATNDPIQQAWEEAQQKAANGIQAIVEQDHLQDIIKSLQATPVHALEERFRAAEAMSSGPSAAAAA